MAAEDPKKRGEDEAIAPRTKGFRAKRPAIAIAALVVTCVAVAALLAAGMFRNRSAASFPTASVSSGEAKIGGPFTMVDQDGRVVDQRILNGDWSAVFFGYTYCPDVCPATLQTLAATAQKLGPRAKDFQVVFVSVDPARDTPAQLKSYLSNQVFPRRTIGLTGTPEQLGRITRAYRVYYARSGSGADYTMDHSAAIYLMNPQGRFASVLSESFGPDRMAQQIAQSQSQE